MTQAKESNFVSAVVYLRNDAARVGAFLQAVCEQLERHFAQFEVVAVDDCSTDGTADEPTQFPEKVPRSHLNLGGREAAREVCWRQITKDNEGNVCLKAENSPVVVPKIGGRSLLALPILTTATHSAPSLCHR